MAKRAGTLAVALTANSTQFDRTLARAQIGIKNFTVSSKALVGGLKTAFAGLGVAMGGAAMIGFGKELIGNMDQIAKSADKLGISTDRYQMLAYAAKRTGTDMGSVESAIKRVNTVLGKAAVGDQAAINSFRLLGLEVNNLKGLSPDKVFDAVAEALGNMEDPAARNAAIMEVFGKNGAELTNFMRDYVQLGDEARDKGFIIQEKQLRAAEKMTDALNDIQVAFTALIADSKWFFDLIKYSEMLIVHWGHVWHDVLSEVIDWINAIFNNSNAAVIALRKMGAIKDVEIIKPLKKFDYSADSDIAAPTRAEREAEKQQWQAEKARRAEQKRIRDEELARRQAEAQKKVKAAATPTPKTEKPDKGPRTAAIGAFSLRDLGRMVTQTGAAERTAKATEETARNTAMIARGEGSLKERRDRWAIRLRDAVNTWDAATDSELKKELLEQAKAAQAVYEQLNLLYKRSLNGEGEVFE